MIYENTKGQTSRDFYLENIQSKLVYSLKAVENSIKVLARAMLNKVVAPW